MMIRPIPIVSLAVSSLVAALSAGCVHPLDRGMDQALREQMIASSRAYRDAVRDAATIEVTRDPSAVVEGMRKHPKRLKAAEEQSGLAANLDQPLLLGPDLMGNPQFKGVSMTLERANRMAIQNGLDLRLARLVPAVADTQIIQAEAAFDATFFSNFTFTKLDTPQPPALLGLGTFGTVQSDTRELQTGIRKLMTTGGQIQVSTLFNRQRRVPSFFAINTFYESNVELSLTQPLLRNFGSDITRSQILLSRNTRHQGIADLKQRLLDTALTTEQAYWQLFFSQQRLLAQLRLLDRSKKNLEIVEARQDLDATEVELGQSRADVAQRQRQVFEAERDFRNASDQLKQLVNSPDLPLAGEEVILPLDTPLALPADFNLRVAVQTAFRNRPDLQRALSEISDATIRQRVADNQRLPLLDLAATVRYNGITIKRGEEIDKSYDHLTEGEFIDYVLSLQFEQPIGYRAAEAFLKQRRIEKEGAVINYQRIAQTAVLEIKQAIREIQTGYKSIDVARDERLASAASVIALEHRRKNEVLSPAFVNVILNEDEQLTRAEIMEFGSLVNYNIAISNFYRTVGTLLQRNGIKFAEE